MLTYTRAIMNPNRLAPSPLPTPQVPCPALWFRSQGSNGKQWKCDALGSVCSQRDYSPRWEQSGYDPVTRAESKGAVSTQNGGDEGRGQSTPWRTPYARGCHSAAVAFDGRTPPAGGTPAGWQPEGWRPGSLASPPWSVAISPLADPSGSHRARGPLDPYSPAPWAPGCRRAGSGWGAQSEDLGTRPGGLPLLVPPVFHCPRCCVHSCVRAPVRLR
uniref:Uncharacterized protein n=1 Tax=Myotis myotis TaxID=51298 RepID=A0A7J7T6H1_MYOMY|nr:hypothetical protein mMyoMyo1_009135 [Myotis myotis]